MTTNNFKPILSSTEMVQAILAGRKTQTRRISGLKKINTEPDHFGLGNVRWNKFWNFYRKSTEKGQFIHSNFQIDDILWVRETFGITAIGNMYKASVCSPDCDKPLSGWKPSLFMPKEAARIFLKVTNVRCERLQDISEGDAISEGVKLFDTNLYKDYEDNKSPGVGKARVSFATLWDSINAKKHPWESNPWVWVYDFERIEKPENFI